MRPEVEEPTGGPRAAHDPGSRAARDRRRSRRRGTRRGGVIALGRVAAGLTAGTPRRTRIAVSLRSGVVSRWLVGAWCAVALLGGATGADAHAVLAGSSIGKDALAAGAATSATLSFNAGIEAALAKVVLRGAAADRPLETRAGARASELVVQIPPLSPGAYALHYKVLAVDGHLTEGVLRFTVAAP
jgi:methionine-rich copper-binding protein CopC